MHICWYFSTFEDIFDVVERLLTDIVDAGDGLEGGGT